MTAKVDGIRKVDGGDCRIGGLKKSCVYRDNGMVVVMSAVKTNEKKKIGWEAQATDRLREDEKGGGETIRK